MCHMRHSVCVLYDTHCMCHMTHTVSHIHTVCVIWHIQTLEYNTTLLDTYRPLWQTLNVSYDTYSMSHTRWRRPIGSLKSQVIFNKTGTNYRALLRKTILEDKAFYDSTPPCINKVAWHIYASRHVWICRDIFTYKCGMCHMNELLRIIIS